MQVGFIGLGIMGKPMVHHLLDAGFALTAKVARKSDVIIAIVNDTPDVKEVLFGPHGVAEGVSRGKIVIDMSTISPEATERFAKQFAERGVEMLDAPVSGGDTGAIAGTLSIMVGGPEVALKKCMPILEVLGKNITHIGEEHGSGQVTKLCNQIGCALNILAVCEELTLAAKSNIDLNKMFTAISAGAAGSWQLTNLAPKILKRDLEPGFMVKTIQKDLRLVMEAAGDGEATLP